MSLDLTGLQEEFPELDTEPLPREEGATAYRILVPDLKWGKQFEWAELRLPKGFPEHGLAKVFLSQDAVLRIPHVEDTGALCISGDPGPSFGRTPEERIYYTLLAYRDDFLYPWMAGDLDGDFAEEPRNYWWIAVDRKRSERNPVSLVVTVDECPKKAVVKEGSLLLPGRIVIADDGQQAITEHIIRSLGNKARQRLRVVVAHVPIPNTLTPSTWPRSNSDLHRILKGRLNRFQKDAFARPIRSRKRGNHRIVILRNSACSFAYLLPGGPPTTVPHGNSNKAFPSLKDAIPLSVTRFDPSWTVSRDQCPAVTQRQCKHVLIVGAGALGSPVVDVLAKSGVGKMTLVDPQLVESANFCRHLLGAESFGQSKAMAVADRVNLGHPSTNVTPVIGHVERWLQVNCLDGVDLILDLTGEPDVRWHLDQARAKSPCAMMVGWMEPYVTAAHVCILPAETPWMRIVSGDPHDPLNDLQAITWPPDVYRQEPGCSSRFQSYTAAAAAYAVAIVSEHALNQLDRSLDEPKVVSWVRGQKYLDDHWEGLELREWAESAKNHDGILIERPFL